MSGRPATDTDAPEERLYVLEAAIQREDARSRLVMDVIERMATAVIAHGDAELLQQVQAILANYRAVDSGLLEAADSRLRHWL